MKKGISLLLPALLLPFFSCDNHTKPNQPPIVVIGASPTSGVAPLSVSFTSAAEDSDGAITAYSWNFGDGNGTSAQQNPSYTYNTPGTYIATCTVTDNGKQPLTASATTVITVYQSKVPALSSISPTWSVIHMPTFTMTVTGADFFPDSKIVFAGKEMATTYISPTQLSCSIMPDDTVLPSALRNDGSLNLEADQYTGVLVRNPGTGGGDSASMQFTIRPNHVFDTPVLVNDSSYSWWNSDPALHMGKNLYVAFAIDGSDDSRIKASKDLGRTWSEAYGIPWLHLYWKFTIAAGYDGILYLFNEEYLHKSSDDGETWSDGILVSDGTPDEGCIVYWTDHPNIIRLKDGTLYAVWGESKNRICPDDLTFLSSWILHCTSKDGGLTWSPAVKYPPFSDYNFFGPQMVLTASGRIHLFFGTGIDPQYPTGYHHITSSDGGKSWSSPVEVSSFEPRSNTCPYVGDDDTLYSTEIIAGASSQEITIKYWRDGAPSWERTQAAVSLDLSQTIKAISVSVDSVGNINLFYTRGPNPAKYAVYYQRSIDIGKTWTTPIMLSSLGLYAVGYSQVCGADGNIFIIWASMDSPNPIYFTGSERNQ